MEINDIGVHTGQMQTDIQNLRSMLSQTRRHLQSLSDSMESLNQMWSGEANAAMRLRFQQDYNSLSALCAFIEKLIQAMESSRQDYDQCDNQVASAVASLIIQ